MAGHKPTDAWKGPGTGNKLLKGSGGTLGSVSKSLGQSPGEERPLQGTVSGGAARAGPVRGRWTQQVEALSRESECCRRECLGALQGRCLCEATTRWKGRPQAKWCLERPTEGK